MLWLMSNIHCIVATRTGSTEDLSLSLLLLVFMFSSSRFFTNSATLFFQDCWSPAGPLFSFSFFWTWQQRPGSGTLNQWGDTMVSFVHGRLSFSMCFWAMFLSMSTARARMRRGTRQTAAERKSDEEFDVQQGSPGAQKQPPVLVPKEAARPSAKASRNSTNITNATKRKSDEEFDVQKRSPKILKNRPKPSAKATRNSTCQTSPLVTLFMSVLRLSLGNPRPVVGRCQSSLSGDHKPRCSASCSCRPAHRQCKARAAELCGNACAAPDCSCIAPRSPGRSPSVWPCRHGPARPRR